MLSHTRVAAAHTRLARCVCVPRQFKDKAIELELNVRNLYDKGAMDMATMLKLQQEATELQENLANLTAERLDGLASKQATETAERRAAVGGLQTAVGGIIGDNVARDAAAAAERNRIDAALAAEHERVDAALAAAAERGIQTDATVDQLRTNFLASMTRLREAGKQEVAEAVEALKALVLTTKAEILSELERRADGLAQSSTQRDTELHVLMTTIASAERALTTADAVQLHTALADLTERITELEALPNSPDLSRDDEDYWNLL